MPFDFFNKNYDLKFRYSEKVTKIWTICGLLRISELQQGVFYNQTFRIDISLEQVAQIP